jgi:hypothetical protein
MPLLEPANCIVHAAVTACWAMFEPTSSACVSLYSNWAKRDRSVALSVNESMPISDSGGTGQFNMQKVSGFCIFTHSPLGGPLCPSSQCSEEKTGGPHTSQ